MKQKVLRANLFIGLGLIVFSVVLLALSVPFMKHWFYTFAWWSFILFLDGLNYRLQGDSLLARSVKKFFLLAFYSISFWCFFEICDLRLQNWSYPRFACGAARTLAGLFLSYATVIPALKELEIFWYGFLKGKALALFRLRASRDLLISFYVSGAACLVLSLVWPRLFFPLIWLAFAFLLEPLNYSQKNPSLLAEVEEGKWDRFWSVVLAGLTAGFFWEFWNFWAGSHWEYYLPYLNFGRIFKMPVLGYTGFMPFALEAFAATSLFLALVDKWGRKRAARLIFFPACLLFDAFTFYLIDLFIFKP